MRGIRRESTLACCALALLGLACDTTQPPPIRDSPSVVRREYRPGKLTLAEKADLFERELWERHVAPEGVVLYSIRLRERSERPRHYGNLADAAYWTGCALAAEALRWSVTGDRDALDCAARLVDGLALLQRVTGVPGLLARTIDPEPDEAAIRGDQGVWSRAAPPYDRYWVKGDVSKDQYCGVAFGYATAYDLLPAGDTRDAIRRDLGEIAHFLDRNDLVIRDAHGKATTYAGLEAWIGPVPLGPNALIALAIFSSAAHATGDAAIESRHLRLVRERYPEACAHAKFEAFGKTNHSNDMMSFLSYYTVLRLETEPEVRAPIERGIDGIWEAVSGEHNALFASIHCALRREEPDTLADIRETLRLFPETKRVLPVDNRGRADVPLSAWTNRKGKPKSAVALPINQRPMSSMYWKSDPYELDGDLDAEGDQEYAGVDYLLAYWMARRHGLLEESRP
ncbi:MAG: hypothetical protein HYR85_00300 [Planctomycetes bacterium]|nr:hypothetical protein [Planctomycetota bacterium]MBI3844973.1 hypothetical protein [Planctomycetota bacterium]